MCAALVGGMDRLRNEYIEAAKGLGVTLKVFTGQERSIKNQLGDLDMMILFTGKVSHAARVEAIKHAKANRIPVHMVHSSGVSALRKCFENQ
jgi:ABC-type sugar transport system substrate-binding protein